MTNCPTCGASVPAEAAHCPACGATLGGADAGADPYAPSEALIYEDPAAAPSEQGDGGEYGIPFGVGTVLGSAFSLWSRTLGRLFLMALIPYAALIPLGGATGALFYFSSTDDGYLVPAIALLVVTILAALPLSIAAAAGSYLLLDDQARDEHTRGVGQAFGQGFHFFWRFLGIGLLMLLMMCGFGLVATVGFALHWAVGGLIILAEIPVGAYIFVRWLAVWPVIVIEDRGGIESLGRSADLVSGRWWGTFGIFMLYFLILLGVQLVASVIGMIPFLGQIVSLVVGILINCLTFAFTFSLYAGLRHRETAGY